MSQTLLDILTTSQTDDTPAELRATGENLSLSIRDHLWRLLNSRRGSLTHLPHYGMPDIAALYLDLPYTRDRIMACIRQCIDDFEPRLQQPQIRPLCLDKDNDFTPFEVVGETPHGQRLKYTVSLYRNGHIQVAATGEYRHHG